MAPAKEATSFDDIIQAGRARARNEALADEIFGRGRQSIGAQSKDALRKTAYPGSLASRITPAGVGKRSVSASSIKQNKPPSRPSSAAAQKARVNRIGASLTDEKSQANILPPNKSQNISIRGISSGPFYVQASNFAPGTTAADIESALLSIGEGISETTLTSCRIMTSTPTVIAEMVFTDRVAADEVVKSWNGQKADGRILHVHLKDVPPRVGKVQKAAGASKPQDSLKAASLAEDTRPLPAMQAPKELFTTLLEDTAMDNIDGQQIQTDMFDTPRTDSRHQSGAQGAEPDFQDGTYGFADPAQVQQEQDHSRSSHGDEIRQPSYRPARDDRDREYNRNRDRDRRYDERGQTYPRGDPYRRSDHGYSGRDGYDRRDDRRDGGGPPPLYSNGGAGRGGRGGRGGYGYSSQGDRYGRMYSDDLVRGGRPRGRSGY